MAKSRSFSIFLLKKGKDAANSLKADHRLEEGVSAKKLPDGSTLFILDSYPTEPWWKSYFGVDKPLTQATKGALVFLPVDDRCFALSFGHVFHNLDDTAYEYDFGLKVTLNSVDPKLLKSTDVLEPGSARRRRTQVPVDSDLTFFDFDRDSTILKSLTGKVRAEYKDLFRHATGSSNLRISSSLPSDKIPELCRELLKLYGSETYKDVFPDIQNVSPVRDPELLDLLNETLLTAFRSKDQALHLTIPDLIDYRDNVFATFSGCGACDLYEDVFMGSYYAYLADKGKDPNSVSFDNLKQHRLKLVDEDSAPKGNHFSIFKCFVFDTALPNGEGTYHLTEGSWYRIEENFITKLRTYLDPYCIELSLPDYTQNREDAYNLSVADNDPNIICLDQKYISPSGQTPIEACDLYSVEHDVGKLIHIKISTNSATLSHLFNQGVNSVQILRVEDESRDKFIAHIESSSISDEQKEAFKLPPSNQNYAVLFGIVTHKDKDLKSLNFPLFSRISLMRNMKVLKSMGITANFGFIKDDSPKGNSVKRRRKSAPSK